MFFLCSIPLQFFFILMRAVVLFIESNLIVGVFWLYEKFPIFGTICPCFLGQSNILNGSQDIHETKVEIKSNQIKSNFGIDWHVSSEKFWKFYVGVQSILEGIQNENFVCLHSSFWVAFGWCISVGYWNWVSVMRTLKELEMWKKLKKCSYLEQSLAECATF